MATADALGGRMGQSIASSVGSKDLFVEGLKNTSNQSSVGGKDMYVEEDKGPNAATYVVAPVSAYESGSRPLSLKIVLKHQ
jgi:hypothetical protein